MDSGGISDFLQQIPVGFILMFCGSGILLVLVIGYMFTARVRRTRQAVPPGRNEFRTSGAPEDAPYDEASDESNADLPDLDALASAELVQPAAPPAPPRPSGTFSLALGEDETVDVVEVLTVLRDVGEGGLIIRIGDKAYRNPPATADAEFKRRFHNTLRDLTDAQHPVDSRRETAEVVEALEEADETPVVEAPPVVPRLDPSVPAPGDLPKFMMPEGPPVKPKRGQRPVAEPIPEIDIAGAIEAFLQHKLSRTPQYASRSIHVSSAPKGGVRSRWTASSTRAWAKSRTRVCGSISRRPSKNGRRASRSEHEHDDQSQ